MEVNREVNRNLIAIYCRNLNDIKNLANEMRAICVAEPDINAIYKASPTVEIATKLARTAQKEILESGHLRFI